MVKNRLSVFEARLSQADTRLWHVERMAYETGFNECRALVVKILPLAKARLLQIPILAISHAFAILQTNQSQVRGG